MQSLRFSSWGHAPALVLVVVAFQCVGCALIAPRDSIEGEESTESRAMSGPSATVIPRPASVEDTFSLPVPKVIKLQGGAPVWLLPSAQTPLVSVRFVFAVGSSSDPKGQAGLAALMGAMLDEGAGDRDALAFAEAFDFLGASFDVSTDRDTTTISVQVLRRHLELALDLVGDCVQRPAFTPTEWERVKALWMNSLKQRQEDPRGVSRVVADRVFYGDDHPYAHPVRGYESTVDAIGLDQVKEFYRQHLRPDRLTVLATGSLQADEFAQLIDARFGEWKVAGAGVPPVVVESPDANPRFVVVDKPDAPQTVIRIQVPAPPAEDESAAALAVADIVFGGTFTSRLSTNLREDKGFTYGAGSRYIRRRSGSYVLATSSVNAGADDDKTGPSVVEFCREFQIMEEGEFTPAEISKAQASYRSRIIEALESQSGTLSVYESSLTHGGTPQSRSEFYRRLVGASGGAVAEASTKNFVWNDATIVLVGDRGRIEAALEKLRAHPPSDLPNAFALPPLEVRDRDGAPAER